VLTIVIVAIYRLKIHPLSAFPGPPLLGVTGLPTAWRSYVSGTFARQTPLLHSRYGPVVRIGPNHISVDGSIGWSEVYGRRPEFSKHLNYLFDQDHLCLIGAPRDVHRLQRRQLGHAFSDASLTEQEHFVKKQVDLLMWRLAEHAKVGRDINIVRWLNYATFDIISDLIFSSSFGNLENSAYHPWVINFFRSIRGEALLRFIRLYPVVQPLIRVMGWRNIKIANETKLNSAAKALERMELGEKPEGSDRKDMTEYMMRKNRAGAPGLSDMETVVNAMLLIGAGSETTATAMSGFFFYLGREREVYDILTKEIRGAFQTEEAIGMRSAAQLPYLHACTEELLRMYPPVAETPPRVSPGVEIDGKFVPKGVSINATVNRCG
jgi:cytochrome P450